MILSQVVQKFELFQVSLKPVLAQGTFVVFGSNN